MIYFKKNDITKLHHKGFTLIELMVVCVIISIIALIILPVFLKSVEKKKKQDNIASTESTVQIQKSEEFPYRINPEGTLPVFSSENIKIIFSVENHRIGMDVYNRFEADFKGKFLIEKFNDEPVRLDFKFPLGTTEARNVSLKFITDRKTWEPENVMYDKQGIFWTGILEEKDIKAEVSFIAQGRDKFEYSLPPAYRTREVQIELEMEGTPEYFIPDWALQPTSINSEQILWKFNNLVTDRPVIIDFLEAQSPVGRVIFMCKLVGLAVLFFGIGFWYLAALYQVEGLHSFRWAHFFLLALTYSLFFVIFGVLGFRGDVSTETAIGISAALSLPLLTLHVSRIIDMKFALFRNLPFSIFTLILVINGVYGGQLRDYIFIGAAFIVVAFITLTFRKWVSNKEKWINNLESEISKRIEDFGSVVKEAKEISRKAGETLKVTSSSSEFVQIQEEIEKISQMLIQDFKEYDSILLELSKLRSLKKGGDEKEFLRASLERKISLLEQTLVNNKNSMKIICNQFLALKEREEEENKKAEENLTKKIEEEGKVHCFTCGYASIPTQYCPGCGTMRIKVIPCRQCNDTVKIPMNLVNKEALKGFFYCIKCGVKNSLE